jgi:hypothetical protein
MYVFHDFRDGAGRPCLRALYWVNATHPAMAKMRRRKRRKKKSPG